MSEFDTTSNYVLRFDIGASGSPVFDQTLPLIPQGFERTCLFATLGRSKVLDTTIVPPVWRDPPDFPASTLDGQFYTGDITKNAIDRTKFVTHADWLPEPIGVHGYVETDISDIFRNNTSSAQPFPYAVITTLPRDWADRYVSHIIIVTVSNESMSWQSSGFPQRRLGALHVGVHDSCPMFQSGILPRFTFDIYGSGRIVQESHNIYYDADTYPSGAVGNTEFVQTRHSTTQVSHLVTFSRNAPIFMSGKVTLAFTWPMQRVSATAPWTNMGWWPGKSTEQTILQNHRLSVRTKVISYLGPPPGGLEIDDFDSPLIPKWLYNGGPMPD